MNAHRIVIAGGGYVGLVAAKKLAGRLRPGEASVTLLTARQTFGERTRWHQLATGQSVSPMPYERLIGPHGPELRVGTIADLGLDAHAVSLADGERLPYDSLVVALGSTVDLAGSAVPGVAGHARAVTDPAALDRLARELDALPEGSPVVVVGGGLTAIELSTEIAESHPRLAVTIVSPADAGGWLSGGARRHLSAAFDRLRIARMRGRVTAVAPDHVELGERLVPSALTVWAGGFRANPLVAASGLAVDGNGRAVTDSAFRSVSHRGVWAAGDAAATRGPWGDALAMGARVAAFLVEPLAAAVAAGVEGREPVPLRFAYQAECISLGRRDGILQLMRPDGTARELALTGRPAALTKELILGYGRLLLRRPDFSPPSPRSRVRPAEEREMITA